MAAVVGSVSGSVTGNGPQKRVRFGNVEPAIIAILKQLDPLVAVLTLLVCMLLFRVTWTAELGAVAVLTFVISSRVFARAHRDDELRLPERRHGARRIVGVEI